MTTAAVNDASRLDQSFHLFLMKTGLIQPLIQDISTPRRSRHTPGLSVSELMPDRFVEFGQRIDLLRAASKQPDSLGLAMAEKLQRQGRSLLSLIATTAPTLNDALHVLVQYAPLSQGMLPEAPTRQVEAGKVVLRFSSPPTREPADHLIIDAMLALWSAMISQVAPRQGMIAAVQVQYARRDIDHDRLLRNTFKAPVQYQAAQNAMVLSPGVLALVMPDANPQLHQQLRLLGDFLVSLMGAEQTLAMQIHHWLLGHLRGRTPALEQCAEGLGMTSWTMRRRLASEGSSFNLILENLRLSLAQTHIADGQLSNGEISYLLGFSNTGAFQRAYKRWTGKTPGEARRVGVLQMS